MKLDSQSLPHTHVNLKKCSIRSFNTYRDINSSSDANSYFSRSKTTPGAENFPASTFTDDYSEMSLVDETDTEEVYLARRKKPTTRNRPGMEQLAAKQASSTMNMGNEVFLGKGIFCYRCGKADHVLRDCPVPFTKTLAFAPQKGGKGAGKAKSTKPTMIAESENALLGENSVALPLEDQHDEGYPVDSSTTDIPAIDSQNSEPWLATWFQEEYDTFCSDRSPCGLYRRF